MIMRHAYHVNLLATWEGQGQDGFHGVSPPRTQREEVTSDLDVHFLLQMRYTKRVSMWPVGLMSSSGVSTPVLQKGEFIGWYDGFISNRVFPVDMAGFAVSVELLHQVDCSGCVCHLLPDS